MINLKPFLDDSKGKAFQTILENLKITQTAIYFTESHKRDIKLEHLENALRIKDDNVRGQYVNLTNQLTCYIDMMIEIKRCIEAIEKQMSFVKHSAQ